MGLGLGLGLTSSHPPPPPPTHPPTMLCTKCWKSARASVRGGAAERVATSTSCCAEGRSSLLRSVSPGFGDAMRRIAVFERSRSSPFSSNLVVGVLLRGPLALGLVTLFMLRSNGRCSSQYVHPPSGTAVTPNRPPLLSAKSVRHICCSSAVSLSQPAQFRLLLGLMRSPAQGHRGGGW